MFTDTSGFVAVPPGQLKTDRSRPVGTVMTGNRGKMKKPLSDEQGWFIIFLLGIIAVTLLEGREQVLSWYNALNAVVMPIMGVVLYCINSRRSVGLLFDCAAMVGRFFLRPLAEMRELRKEKQPWIAETIATLGFSVGLTLLIIGVAPAITAYNGLSPPVFGDIGSGLVFIAFACMVLAFLTAWSVTVLQTFWWLFGLATKWFRRGGRANRRT